MISMKRDRLIGLAAAILLMSTVFTGLFLGVQTNTQFREIEASWFGYADDAEKKGVWISSIRGYLGYGGIIHNFKNYVLRGEEVYRERTSEQLTQFKAVMANYLAEPLPEAERAALLAINETIVEYETKLPDATRAAEENWSAERTDALVRVDDQAAILALNNLERIWHQNRTQSTARILSVVATGQTLIRVGFIAMFALVVVALLLGLFMALLLRDMRRAMDKLSAELEHRKRLEQSEKLLAETIEQSPATIVITDTDERIQYVNRRFEEITGWDRTEVMGETPRRLQSGETSAAVYAEIRDKLNQGQTWHGLFRNRRKTGGTYWAQTTILPLIGPDGKVSNFIAVGEDITERRIAQEQVARSQKMEAVGLLAGGIAHDFNNILTTIVGAAHLAAMDVDSDSDLAGEIEQIDIAARRAQSLVRQLLTFARRQPGIAVPTDLCAIISEVTRLLRAATSSMIVIETPTQKGPVPVMADPTHLHQILMNLCSNASEAMGGLSGRISISVEPSAVASAGLAKRPDGWVRLVVADDGPGMSDVILSNVFDAFFTTKPIGKGTGLGLAVVQGLVQEMGGQIVAESVPGEGAQFTVWLPGASVLALEEDAVALALPRGQERLLIVDDEVEVASVFRRFMLRLGYQVEGYNSALVALERFRADPERYDLVILDLVMPELSGDELAAAIRDLRRDCPILFCSAYNRTDFTLPGSVPEFLDKPVEPPVLAQRVRAMLDSGKGDLRC